MVAPMVGGAGRYALGHHERVVVLPKFQTCPRDGERVPTQFDMKGDEIEFPGVHICSKGHAFLTRLDPKPGELKIDTEDVKRVN